MDVLMHPSREDVGEGKPTNTEKAIFLVAQTKGNLFFFRLFIIKFQGLNQLSKVFPRPPGVRNSASRKLLRSNQAGDVKYCH